MRYVVVGTSGTGKTTFARQLAASLGAIHVELDGLHWGPDWTPRAPAEFAESVRRQTAGERWVVDGNYGAVREVVWPRATHVVWLNFSRPVVFARVIRRTLRRGLTREKLWAGNRESFRKAFLSRDSILVWSFTTWRKNRLRYAELRSGASYPHLRWHELTSPAAARAFLRECERR